MMRARSILALAAIALLVSCKQTPSVSPTPTPAATAATHCVFVIRAGTRILGCATPLPDARKPKHTATPSPTLAPTLAATATPTLAPAATFAPSPAAAVPTPTPTPIDPAPSGNAQSNTLTGNGSAPAPGVTAGPTPTPTPTPGIPALPYTWVYADGTNGDNKTTTVTQMNNWLYWCEGDGGTQYNSSSAFTVDQCPGGGFPYFSLTMLEPTTSGGSAPSPFTGGYANGSSGGGAGTCPTPWNAANPFAATSGTNLPDFASTGANNWGAFANGTTIGSSGNLITGFSGGKYRFFPNLASTTLQAAANAIIQNCSFGGQGSTAIRAFNLFAGAMDDNVHGGLESQHAVLYDGATSDQYPQGTNWSSGISISPTPAGCTTPCYASSTGITTPATFFSGGNEKTRSSYINGNCTTAAGNTSCQTPTYPADTSYDTAVVSALDSLNHRDGSAFRAVINGMYNGYDACKLLNASTHALAGVVEFAVFVPAENGVPQADPQLRQRVDVASQNAACGGKSFMFLDFYNSSQYNSEGAGTSAPGTPAYVFQEREHFAFLWALTDDTYPSMMASWIQGCVELCPFTEWTDIYAANFATPSGAVEPYFAEALSSSGSLCGENWYYFVFTGNACSAGGMLDQNNTVSTSGGQCASGSVSCVVRRIFNHFYVWNTTACATYSRATWNATCVKDIGPVAIFLNLSGSAITLSQNFFNNALGSYYAQMHTIIEPGCKPLAGLYGNTAGSPLYPSNGLEGTASTTVQCSASTYYDMANGSSVGGYALSNETSIGTSTGPTLHDQATLILANGTP